MWTEAEGVLHREFVLPDPSVAPQSYYRARYYDPQSGRFISEDPLRFGANGTNFYAYVGDDLIKNVCKRQSEQSPPPPALKCPRHYYFSLDLPVSAR